MRKLSFGRCGAFLALSFLALSLLGLSACDTVKSLGSSIKEAPLFSPAAEEKAPQGDVTPPASIVAAVGDDCPQVRVLDDLVGIHQFASAQNSDPKALIADAQFKDVGAACQVAPNSVTLDITLGFEGRLGPQGVKDLNGQANYTYPYFLSVVMPSGQILSKDVFALAMMYDKGGVTMRKQDKLRQTIPLMAGQKPSDFQVIVGFQLSDEELAYNRAHNKVQ